MFGARWMSVLGLTCWLVAAAGLQAAEPAAYQLEAPAGWRKEKIPLPPSFAPKMALRGNEDVRFAPGMFQRQSDSFFSYVVVFWLEPGGDLTAKSLERQLAVYYQGLSETVLKGRNVEVTPRQVSVVLKPTDKKLDARGHAIARLHGEVTWTEPFVTVSQQRLRLEIERWSCDESRRDCLLMIVSPQAEEAAIWKKMRQIRDDFRCHAR